MGPVTHHAPPASPAPATNSDAPPASPSSDDRGVVTEMDVDASIEPSSPVVSSNSDSPVALAFGSLSFTQSVGDADED